MRKPYHRPGDRFSQPTEAAGRQRRPRTFGIMLIFTAPSGPGGDGLYRKNSGTAGPPEAAIV